MTIDHRRQGDGPPLVLIHGIGLRRQIWQPVVGPLARDYTVIACDSPGFGESPPLPDGVRPDIVAYADAFERFFATQRLGRPHVAGFVLRDASPVASNWRSEQTLDAYLAQP